MISFKHKFTKIEIASLVSLFFMVLVWAIESPPIFNTLQDKHLPFTQEEKLDIFLCSTYYHPVCVCVVFLILFMLCERFLLFNSILPMFIREKSRGRFLMKQIETILLFSFVFSFMYEFIGTLGARILFGREVFDLSDVWAYALWDFAALFMFYFKIGVLMLFLSMCTKISISITAIIILYIILVLSKSAQSFIWMPISDIVYLGDLVAGVSKWKDVLVSVLRILGEAVAFSICSWIRIQSKDFVGNEK